MPSQAGSGAHPRKNTKTTPEAVEFQCLLRQGVALTSGSGWNWTNKKMFQCLLRQGVALTL